MDFYTVAVHRNDVTALKKAYSALTGGNWYKARIGYMNGHAGDWYSQGDAYKLRQRIDALEGKVAIFATDRYDLDALKRAYKALADGAKEVTVTFQNGSQAVVFRPLDITKLRQKVLYSI